MKNKDGKVRKGMRMRRLALLLGTCLFMPFANLHALGMGDIDVHSGLNQPLDATIQLLSVDEAELVQLEVFLASKEAFERLGLERLSVLQHLEFKVITDLGVSFVKVSSSVPIREPFLDFILTVSWANGQMLREYTLLLDPPIFDEGRTPSAIEAAVTTPSTISREEVERFADAAERDVSFSPTGEGSYGPTKTSDTLWAVAKQMRGDGSVSVPQMMLALLKENPEAFFNSNVNNLKAGYILRAPQEQAITSISRAQAAAETNKQYQDWLARKGASPTGARQLASGGQVPQVGETAESMKPTSAGESTLAPVSDARLQIVSPDDESIAGSGGGAEIEVMQQKLAMALASTDASRQENADLKQRLVELESQLANMKRLISLQEGTMSQLQAASAEPVSAGVVETSVAEIAAEPTTGAVESVAQAPIDVVKPVIAEPQTAVMDDGAVVSFVDELLADPKMLAAAAGGGVAFLVLVLVIMRRRKAENEDFFDTEDTSLVAGGVSTNSNAGAGAPMTSLLEESAEKPASDGQKDDDFTVDLADLSSSSDEFSGFGNELGSIHTEESEIDPIAEADVYLAYRRYEQAEALLKEAILADDGRNELKVKLLEIYFTTKDQEAFEAQSESLYASLAGSEDGLWEQVVEMGRELCPEHPLFSEGGSTLLDAGDSDYALAGDDLLDSSGDALSDVEFDSLDEPESLSGVSDSLDLDLDSDFDFDALNSETLSSDDSMIDGLDLDVDLGDELENIADLDLGDSFDLDNTKDKDQTVVASTKDKAALDADVVDDLSGLDDFISEAGDSGLDEVVSIENEVDVLDKEFELDTEELSFDGADELAVDPKLESDLTDGFMLNDELEALDDVDTDGGLSDFFGELDDVSLDSNSDSAAKTTPQSEKSNELNDTVSSELGDNSEFDMDFSSSLDEFESLDNVVSFDSQDSSAKNNKPDATPPSSVETSSDLMADLDGLSDVLDEGANDVSLDMDLDGLDLGGLELGEDLPQTTSGLDDLAGVDAGGSEWEIEPAISSFGDMDEEYSLFESSDDVVGTKLDLAKAYIDMGDQDGARSILDEVVKEGSDTQREEAEQLMTQMG